MPPVLSLETPTQELVDEAMPMFESHAESSTPWMAHVKPLASYTDYLLLARLNRVRFFTARVDGKLVGYDVFMIQTVPGYDGHEQAVEIGIYVLPEHRGGVGSALAKHAHDALSTEDIVAIHRFVPPWSVYEKMLTGMGYKPSAFLLTVEVNHAQAS